MNSLGPEENEAGRISDNEKTPYFRGRINTSNSEQLAMDLSSQIPQEKESKLINNDTEVIGSVKDI